MFLEARLKAG